MSKEYYDFSKVPTTLDVSLYGRVEPVTETLSKCRVRIFYKGMNRNRTFISEDFANQLISSLPYTPIKGIFDKEAVDFQDHGEDNTDGRIYGIVMAEPNFAWEDNMDEDGIIRTYACADVLLFTGLYPEAKLIPGESQSMEIFRRTLEGEWRINDEDNMPYFHFLNGSLIGLQVLGAETEPCFEGSAFFSRLDQKDLNDLKEVVNYIKKFSIQEEGQMENVMESPVETTVEATEVVTETAVETTESTVEATVETVETPVEETVETPVAETTDADTTVEPQENTTEEVQDTVVTTVEEAVNATEIKDTVDTTELESRISELEAEKATLTEKISALEAEKVEFEQKVSSLEAEKVEFESQFSHIKDENKTLSAFKEAVETEKKEAILTKYEEHLSESAISALKESISKYSVEDFKKEVCTAAVESDPTIFSKRNSEPELIFKGGAVVDDSKGELTGALRLLNNHKNGGNK